MTTPAAERDRNHGRPERASSAPWVRAVAWTAALFYLTSGVWAMVSPGSFHRLVASFDPLNVHYLRDAGAFSLGLAVALITSLTVTRHALPTVLFAVGIGSIAHTLSHVVDASAGGRPTFDIPSLALLGIVLLAAAWSTRHRPAK